MRRGIITGFVCFVLGGIMGYFVGGTTCAKHYKSTIEELEFENEELTDEIEKTREKAVSEPLRGTVEPSSNIRSEKRREEREKERMRYEDIASNYSGEKSDDDRKKDIHIITEEQFRRDIDYRDSDTVTWYKEDGVLVDSADMPIHDEEDVIGVEALDLLQDYESSFMYVDNEIEDRMYEIIIERNLSYYRDLMGMEG